MTVDQAIDEKLRAYKDEIVESLIARLRQENFIPTPEEKTYTVSEVVDLHLTDSRFKKVSRGWVVAAEERGDLVNVGKDSRHKFTETNILQAMSQKGRKRA